MTELLTAAQMRDVETRAIESGSVSGLELMERAGAGVVSAILRMAEEGGSAPVACGDSPEVFGQIRNAVVLCGPGNNGGDGFVIARLLVEAGWTVSVVLFGDAAKLPPDARVNHDRWCEIGAIQPWERSGAESFADRPLVVDAVFGTGLARPIPGAVREVLWAARGCPVVAVDLPSMLGSDSGADLGSWPDDAGFAHLTVSFHRFKRGHILGAGPRLCGRVELADIGLNGAATEAVRLVEAPEGIGKPQGHKFDHGSALVLTGGMGRTGAARLAARGALRIGAGLVTLAAPGNAMAECAARIDALMLRRCDDAGSLVQLLEDPRITALCLGPGLGVERARDLLSVALEAGLSCVLDADAITALAGGASGGGLHERCVLTPHSGEFARLFPDLSLDAPVEAAAEAAVRAGCTVLLKGPATVIAAPDGRVAVHAAVYERAVPWLATAGAGDVLAGMIAGLMARGWVAFEAAKAGAWLHAEAARLFGPGLIAEDLPEQIPLVLRLLQNGVQTSSSPSA
ncbi:MAG: bifunctional ADP-dependent NAD(P)H-hydrate dehydratase/NAD(P)H-hydrate epimerase [Rhodobacterales bacterium]|nr:MAG: bifunctional ADP-dependent NAD(P)H-hydrate dehydratase/NAD(P)H-hydrate epimerase [Rhodobacterales bacterium]